MWSKTKKALMDRMADSLKKRVRSADTLLLCARDICCGSGYLSTYLDMFRRYQQSSGKDMD